MARIDGIIDGSVEQIEQIPQIEVEVDVDAARRYGITPGTSAASPPSSLASEEVGDIFTGGKAYDVHVWSIPSARDSVTDVENLPIDTPSGEQVPLAPGSRHPDQRRSRTRSSTRSSRAGSTRSPTWTAATSPRPSTTSRSALDEVKFPTGYHAEVLGEATELNAAQDRLLFTG